jgi:glycosyltransferase involved in cell wall biosynthesis
LLTAPDAGAIAEALVSLAGDERRRQRLAATALAAVRERTWEASLDRLAAGYRLALDLRRPGRARSVA